MASSALSDLISIYRFPPGRRIYALRRTHALLPDGDPIRTKIDDAIVLDKGTLDTKTRWQKARDETLKWPQEVIDLDHEHDRLWGALAGACNSLATGLGPDSPQGAAAARLAEHVFSSGVSPLIHLPFVEQRETTDAWLARLHGELAGEVDAAGMGAVVQRITDVNKRFGELVDQRNEKSNMSYSDVRDADEKGHMTFMRILAALIGRDADNDAERERVLAPILAQNDAIGEAYRRRRAVPDVDPNTGEPTDPSVEG